MPRIRLVFADGACVADLPDGIAEQALEERVGPILAAVVTSCAPDADGLHTVALPEIPTAALGAPLRHFLSHGKLPPPSSATPPLLLAAAYKAAEWLDLKGLVRAVERAVMAVVATGDVQLEEVALAFAGCPRVAGLCDNYLELPGVRPPPPFNITTHLPALVAEHGALLLVGTNASHADEFWVLADIAACLQRTRIPPITRGKRNDVFMHIAEHNAESTGQTKGLYLFSMTDWEKDMTGFGALHPGVNETWITEELEPEVVTPRALLKAFATTTIDLVVDSQGKKIYSRHMLSDFTLAHGFERRYGPYRAE
jgi:hypothetical protein